MMFEKYQNVISKTDLFLQHFEFHSHANNWSQCKNGTFKHMGFFGAKNKLPTSPCCLDAIVYFRIFVLITEFLTAV